MGELLWNPIYQFTRDFAYHRPYFIGAFVYWQPGSFIVEPGNPFIVQEVLFGGYKVYVKFQDYFWNFSTSTYHVPELLEDFYAIHPLTGAHVYAGDVLVSFGYSMSVGFYYLNFQFGVVGGDYLKCTFPPATPDYWMYPYGWT